jgi:hypothetical protein
MEDLMGWVHACSYYRNIVQDFRLGLLQPLSHVDPDWKLFRPGRSRNDCTGFGSDLFDKKSVYFLHICLQNGPNRLWKSCKSTIMNT